jgi:isopentenyl diphosphate isomerase/L-lactate dehydrogenase-like FMN-dependent dehydrogenase
VLIGRATLYGVAAAGETGARDVLEMLRAEIERTMILMGVASVRDLDPARVRREPHEHHAL